MLVAHPKRSMISSSFRPFLVQLYIYSFPPSFHKHVTISCKPALILGAGDKMVNRWRACFFELNIEEQKEWKKKKKNSKYTPKKPPSISGGDEYYKQTKIIAGRGSVSIWSWGTQSVGSWRGPRGWLPWVSLLTQVSLVSSKEGNLRPWWGGRRSFQCSLLNIF